MKAVRSSLSFLHFTSIILLLVLAAGCGQGTAVSNAKAQPTPTPTPTISNPSNFVYVTVNSTSSVEGFKIDSSGAVTPIPGSPFAVPQGPVSIARNQDFLFVGSEGFNPTTPDKSLITTYQIDPASGALTQVAQQHTLSFIQNNMEVDPAGRFLYTDGVEVFSIGANGQLTAIPGAPFGSPSALVFVQGPITFHPTGKFLYSVGVSDGHNAFQSAIFADVDSQTGVPSNGQMLGPETFDLAITPDGKFMVATDANVSSQNRVCTYTIDPITGAPSSAVLGGQPVTPVSCTTAKTIFLAGVAIDPSGSLVVITGDVALFLFRLSNGIISPAGSTPVQLPMRPGLIAFSRDGKYLFVAGGSPSVVNPVNQVNVFRVDVVNGTLTPAPGSPFVLKDTPWDMIQ